MYQYVYYIYYSQVIEITGGDIIKPNKMFILTHEDLIDVEIMIQPCTTIQFLGTFPGQNIVTPNFKLVDFDEIRLNIGNNISKYGIQIIALFHSQLIFSNIIWSFIYNIYNVCSCLYSLILLFTHFIFFVQCLFINILFYLFFSFLVTYIFY